MSQIKNKKGKIKKRIVVGLVLVVSIGLATAYLLFRTNQATLAVASQNVSVQTMALQKTDLVNSISASGSVYSANSQNVYTTLSYPVQEVLVEVGDQVKAGDVLAVLDLTNLDYEIKQAELNLESARTGAVETVQSNSDSVKNAEISLSTAKINLEKQQRNYDKLKEELANETSSELISAQNTIDSAYNTLVNAEKDKLEKSNAYQKDIVLFNAGVISQSEQDNAKSALETAENTYKNAQSSYEKALANYDQVKAGLESDLITAEKDLESSKLSLQNAQNSLTQAQNKTSSSTSIENQMLSLEKLEQQQAQGKIISPIDGTITAVNAVVGSSPSGILFVVQDMDDLYVSVKIKEFKIGNIAIGQNATATTDATGNQVFTGIVDFISPVAAEASSTTNVEYEVHVKLTQTDPNIRIGMNAYSNIILETSENVYAVPIDAIVNKRREGNFIYIVDGGIVKELPVTLGLENDTMTEISGDDLKDGLNVVTSASTVVPGQSINDPAEQGGTPVLPEGQMPSNGQIPSNGQMPTNGQIRSGTQFPQGGEMPRGNRSN